MYRKPTNEGPGSVGVDCRGFFLRLRDFWTIKDFIKGSTQDYGERLNQNMDAFPNLGNVGSSSLDP